LHLTTGATTAKTTTRRTPDSWADDTYQRPSPRQTGTTKEVSLSLSLWPHSLLPGVLVPTRTLRSQIDHSCRLGWQAVRQEKSETRSHCGRGETCDLFLPHLPVLCYNRTAARPTQLVNRSLSSLTPPHGTTRQPAQEPPAPHQGQPYRLITSRGTHTHSRTHGTGREGGEVHTNAKTTARLKTTHTQKQRTQRCPVLSAARHGTARHGTHHHAKHCNQCSQSVILPTYTVLCVCPSLLSITSQQPACSHLTPPSHSVCRSTSETRKLSGKNRKPAAAVTRDDRRE